MSKFSAIAGRLLIQSALIGAVAVVPAMAENPVAIFNMVPSSAGCVANASARVSINSLGDVETLNIAAVNLPPNTGFDLFVIQSATPPFGLSWYVGDMQSNAQGRAVGAFVGRFSREAFIVAPGVTSAPRIDAEDATQNPQTAPVHTLHLGLWFNSPTDAQNAGCPSITTPFNGEHNAGVQVLNTKNFTGRGPLNLVFP